MVQSVGPVILESILALDGVKAIVWAGLGSQESGNALVDILYGSTSPSGKLPCKYQVIFLRSTSKMPSKTHHFFFCHNI